jgi:hypothetical protein
MKGRVTIVAVAGLLFAEIGTVVAGAAYRADTSADLQRTKVIRAKPRAFVEDCYVKSAAPVFVAEAPVVSSRPVSKCSELSPVQLSCSRLYPTMGERA